MATVRYFAAAAEAAGRQTEVIAPGRATTVRELRAAMVREHGPELGRVLGRCSVLVSGVRAGRDDVVVGPDDVVDVLPPFAGG